MAVNLDQLKSLRAKTGVSMQACKKVLEETGGDEEKSIELLRKRGEAKAVDRAGRTAGEGIVAVATNGKKTIMVKVACETDFTARSDDFVKFANEVAERIAKSADGKVDFGTELTDLTSKVGEKIEIGEAVAVEDERVGSYVHTTRKLGALVGLSGGPEELARDVAMHIAASSPTVVKPEEVSQTEVDKEREIWKEELKKQNKPENMWDNIMKGKEKKFREEQSLLSQPFVKNPEITIGKYIEDQASGVEVHAMHRVCI